MKKLQCLDIVEDFSYSHRLTVAAMIMMLVAAAV